MVAGATGFAPIKSILEDAFARGVQRQMQLYWGVSDARDLYMLNLAERWAHEHANFTVIPVLSDTTHSPEWAGRTGLVHQAMLADHPDLRGHEVRSEEHTSELQSLMRISYAVFCWKKKNTYY